MQRILTIIAATGCAVALLLSHAAPSPGASAPTRYTVKAGDTLWAIADGRYADRDPRAAVYDIQQANHLDGSSLAVGQTLLLP
jgi:LysM repeat protein